MASGPSIPTSAAPARGRGIYCNRTLNLRAIRAVGYDMDYTLVHYNVEAWEQRAYDHLQQRLLERGWPVADLQFSPAFAMRGLVIDTALGNIVKADRFGYVKRAYHGTRRLEFDQQRETYARTLVDLSDARWMFLNTFFSLSEACMYAQLVDRLDARRLPGVMGYRDLWDHIRHALDATHAEGLLKTEILEQPERYVDPDPEVALAVLDQKESGKRLLLVTNSEWSYTAAMMGFCFDRFLRAGTTWRDLFELTIVAARKPEFFSGRGAMFSVVTAEGLLSPCIAGPTGPGVYLGGNADLVEGYLGLSGAEILFVGDHLDTDVRVSKDVRRWRTCLIAPELEGEIEAEDVYRAHQDRLDALMAEKTALEREQARLRLVAQRQARKYGPVSPVGEPEPQLARLRARVDRLDEEIGPLAARLGSLYNETWGPLMRAGNDPSLLAGVMESYADVYTSRVANFLAATPFAYLRSPRAGMAHDTASP